MALAVAAAVGVRDTEDEELDAAISYLLESKDKDGGCVGCEGAMKQERRRLHGFYKLSGQNNCRGIFLSS